MSGKKNKRDRLKNKAWRLMSEWVRRKNANHSGLVRCVTCSSWHPWKEIHAGHFYHAGKLNFVSYDARNINPQCPRCNYYGARGEASISYTLFIQDTYGREAIDALKAKKSQSPPMLISDLEEVIAKLEGRLETIGR